MNQVQDNLSNSLQPLFNNPLLNGQILKDVSFVENVFKEVPHKLGRKPQGYFLVGQTQVTVLYDDQANEPLPELFLRLASIVTGIVNIYVF